MSTDKTRLEIGHVLFIDIVGYSKLLLKQQSELLRELNEVVSGTNEFRQAESAGRLIRLPTRDGMALVFRTNSEAPVECAMEIARTLKSHPAIQRRMGIHSGPVNEVVDVNQRANIAGAGINLAQRVMDCGDAGHILLSKHVAEDLEQDDRWRPLLHDLGTCEVKHGVRVGVTNLYSDDVGNPQLPKKFQALKKHRSHVHWAEVAIALLVLAAVAGAFIFVLRKSTRSTLSVAEKSIAVLPFENLSADPQNAFFAEGVQDEILNNLAKIADLKVISRTSVMQYKTGVKRNLGEIANALGVAHVIEGTVQRTANRVRVSAQLIDARTDNHLWAEHYDRDLADVFAIQSELAEQIVSQLKAKLSPEEKAAIEQKPTADLAAYDLYIRAKILIASSVLSTPQAESLLEAIRLLNQAVERDPAFALAYYQLAYAHDVLYFVGTDHTAARLAMADAAIESLSRLRPNSGEAHLALANHLYFGHYDYDRARKELSLAQTSLPNEPAAFELAGYIDRRQGRWAESTKNLERAVELDPRNVFFLQQIARSYGRLRRFADAARVLDRAVAITPKDAALRVTRADIELDWHADPRPLTSTIQTILTEDPREAENIAEAWLLVSQCQRDVDGAQRALDALPNDGCHAETIPFPKTWCQGVVAQMRGDSTAARTAFAAVHNEAEKMVREQPAYAEAFCVLAMADAALGQKEDAIREGRRAVELLPVTKDSITGSLLLEFLALTYAWTGEKDLALQQLAVVASIPSELSYGQLRLHPYWDPLRGDPRFEQIVVSLAPK